MHEKRKTPAFVSRPLLAAFCFQNQAILVIPAGFEPTACRLGDQEGVRLGLPSKRRKALVLLGF